MKMWDLIKINDLLTLLDSLDFYIKSIYIFIRILNLIVNLNYFIIYKSY